MTVVLPQRSLECTCRRHWQQWPSAGDGIEQAACGFPVTHRCKKERQSGKAGFHEHAGLNARSDGRASFIALRGKQ